MKDSPSSEMTPDRELSAKIVQDLVARGFVTEEKKEVIATKFANGQFNAEEWRILAAASLINDEASKEGAV